MTSLKTPKQIMNTYDWIKGWSVNMNVEKILKEDRQATAQVLCDLLEGIEAPECIDDSCEHIHEGYFQAIEKAQALIRQTLDAISNQG